MARKRGNGSLILATPLPSLSLLCRNPPLILLSALNCLRIVYAECRRTKHCASNQFCMKCKEDSDLNRCKARRCVCPVSCRLRSLRMGNVHGRCSTRPPPQCNVYSFFNAPDRSEYWSSFVLIIILELSRLATLLRGLGKTCGRAYKRRGRCTTWLQ